jgi:hypothetical protein
MEGAPLHAMRGLVGPFDERRRRGSKRQPFDIGGLCTGVPRQASTDAALLVVVKAPVDEDKLRWVEKELFCQRLRRFFVMRLKDRYAGAGLDGYANAASLDDLEYAEEVQEMARRAGPYHPACKRPD